MSELDFGPHEQDFFVYNHMLTAARVLKPDSNVLNPNVSYAFEVQDQRDRCRAKGIGEDRIMIGAAIADINAMNRLREPVDDFFEEVDG